MAKQVYIDKSFAKLMLQKMILRANDKLHPASMENWRKIFAGNGESYVNKDGKTVKLTSLIGIEIVEYDKKQATGAKTGRSLEYNLTVPNIAMIMRNIYNSANYSGVLFSDVKTHAFVKNNAGKGEVLNFEIRREPKMRDGAQSKYPYLITIKKGWAFLLKEGVGFTSNSYEQDFYLSVRLSYADICAFFEAVQQGIDVFRMTEGTKLRRKGMEYEMQAAKQAAMNAQMNAATQALSEQNNVPQDFIETPEDAWLGQSLPPDFMS